MGEGLGEGVFTKFRSGVKLFYVALKLSIMAQEDAFSLIHPVLAIVVVFPVIGMVIQMAWQTRQRRLQTISGQTSKIPAIVGPEHRKLGYWLTGSVVGVTLVALAYSIYFKGIFPDLTPEKYPQAIFIGLMFILTVTSLVFLYQARQRLWRGIFASLTGAGLIILGCQEGVWRLSDKWYQSHYYYGIIASLITVFSLSIVPEIYQDRSQTWRKVHTGLSCFALLLFIGQGITGTRDLLDIPLSWQKPFLYQCDWNNQTCPNFSSSSQSSDHLSATTPSETSESDVTVIATGQFSTITPGEDTAGTAELVQMGDQLQVRLNQDFQTKEGPAVRILLHQQSSPTTYTPDNYVLLGNLQEFQGEQTYVIPSGVEWQNYPHLIIWCEEFNVTFGGATLQ